MESSEFSNIIAALLIFTLVIGATLAWDFGINGFALAFFFSTTILFFSIAGKKLIAYSLDSKVDHEIWKFYRFGFKKHRHLPKEIPAGLLTPLFFLIFSLGQLKVPTLLTYQTSPLKVRASKKFGYRSYSEMTDWHNSIIGSAGTVSLWILIVFCFILSVNFSDYSFELIYLAKMASMFAFWNVIPVSNLDGSQIFMGSRVLYTFIASITTLFMAFALLIPA